MQGSAGFSKALSLLMGANVKVRRFGIGLQEEEMGHQMKNIGRSKNGMLYDSVLGSDGCILLLLSLTAITAQLGILVASCG